MPGSNSTCSLGTENLLGGFVLELLLRSEHVDGEDGLLLHVPHLPRGQAKSVTQDLKNRVEMPRQRTIRIPRCSSEALLPLANLMMAVGRAGGIIGVVHGPKGHKQVRRAEALPCFA